MYGTQKNQPKQYIPETKMRECLEYLDIQEKNVGNYKNSLIWSSHRADIK